GRPRRGPRHARRAPRPLGDVPRDRRVAAPGGGRLMARDEGEARVAGRGGGAPVGGTAGGGPAGAPPARPGGKAGGTLKETERVRTGGPIGGAMVGGKAEAFGPSARRLAGLLKPFRLAVAAIGARAVVAVLLGAVGPRVLGRATDLIFGGVIGAQMPAGITKAEAVAGARAAGREQVAQMLSG